MQELFSCRICLEDSVREELIAPCACKGSSKYVHRACLNQWRTIQEDRAFSKCTECLTPYTILPRHADSLSASHKRRILYCLYVSRDFFVALVGTQIIIFALSYLTYSIDGSHKMLDSFGATGSPAPFYYFCGMLIFFAIIGLLAIIASCGNNPGDCTPLFHCNHGPGYGHCCRGVYISECPNCCVFCSQCGECSCCSAECGGCSACVAGDASAECVPLLIFIFIALAVVGVLVSIFAGMAYATRVTTRHLVVLQKQGLADDFIVADLELAESAGGLVPGNNGYIPLQRRESRSMVRDGVDSPLRDIETGNPLHAPHQLQAVNTTDQRMLRDLGLI